MFSGFLILGLWLALAKVTQVEIDTRPPPHVDWNGDT